MLRKKDIARLWSCMVRIYGQPWLHNYGKVDNGIWLAGLQDLTWGDLKRGMKRCTQTPSEYPPNLPRFREYCQPEPAVPTAPKLPKPWANRELVERSLAECHGILQRKTKAR